MVAAKSLNHLLRLLPVLLPAALLAACERVDEAYEPDTEAIVIDEPVPGFGIPMTFAYSCKDGSQFILLIEPEQDYLTLMLDERQIRLQPVSSPTGTHYEAEDIVFLLRENLAVLHYKSEAPVTCLENRRMTLIEDARHRNVTLWGTGHRPDWRLELGPTHILLETMGGTELHIFPMDHEPEIVDGTTHYESSNHESRIVISAELTTCHDNISDVTYDATISISLDDTELNGCGVFMD